MRITSKGQVTIPADIREKAGFEPNSEVDFVIERGKVILRKHIEPKTCGSKLVAHLRGKGTVKMSTEQIMALTRGE